MRSFKDSSGNTWLLSITVAGLERVKDLAGVDLCDLTSGEPPLGARLTTEPMLVGSVLFALVSVQAAAAGVDAASFKEGLDGDALSSAFDGFVEELIDFFRKAKRPEQATALNAQLKVLLAASSLATKKIQEMDLNQLVENAFKSSSFAGSLPESSVSMQAP
jgi:hypothetical protein